MARGNAYEETQKLSENKAKESTREFVQQLNRRKWWKICPGGPVGPPPYGPETRPGSPGGPAPYETRPGGLSVGFPEGVGAVGDLPGERFGARGAIVQAK